MSTRSMSREGPWRAYENARPVVQTYAGLKGITMNQSTSDETAKSTSLTISLRDATAADLDPERRAAHESAYRRGVHQALAFAGDIVDRAATLKEAQRLLCRAENLAGRLRFIRKDQGNMMLLDHMRTKLYRPAQKRGGC